MTEDKMTEGGLSDHSPHSELMYSTQVLERGGEDWVVDRCDHIPQVELKVMALLSEEVMVKALVCGKHDDRALEGMAEVE